MPTFFAMLIKNPCVRLSSYVKITVVESHSQLITKSSSCAHPLMASIRLEQVQESFLIFAMAWYQNWLTNLGAACFMSQKMFADSELKNSLIIYLFRIFQSITHFVSKKSK